ncbi:MAG: putative porin [Acidobacteriota bacterium]|nr:putative porin [Acidobacteriota bacterium]
MRAALVAAVLSVLCAGAARAQEAEYFPEEQKPRLVLQWDFLARYDRIEKLIFRPDIFRGRFEARPELDLVLSQRLRIGARAVADVGTDSNATNDVNFDNYRSNGATLERYFVEAKPGRLAFRVGSFGMPFVATEMLWDHDIQTLGASAAWEIPLGSSTLTVVGGGFRGPQREGDRTRVAAGQVVWRMGDPASLSVEAAASYWDFDPRRLRPIFGRQNYFTADPAGGARFVSRFQIVDGILRVRFPIGKAPVMVSLDGLANLGARAEAKNEGTAFEGSVVVGGVGTPGDVRAFYTYQHVERDAVLGAYNTDDWWFHSWYEGHRFALAVTVYPRVFIQATGMIQRRLDRQNHLNRVTVDLVKMF